MKSIKSIFILAIIAMMGLWVTAQVYTLDIYQNGVVSQSIPIANVDSIKIEKINAIAIDSGLPSDLKWATCNVGATSPEEYGNYYAWAEIAIKPTYTESNSCTRGVSLHNIAGNVAYDVARYMWGGTWQMPTDADLIELRDNCDWEWITQNGINGYNVTGPNGNSIFLPAAGYCCGSYSFDVGSSGYYWTLTPAGSEYNYAFSLVLNANNYDRYTSHRFWGYSVRPVTK